MVRRRSRSNWASNDKHALTNDASPIRDKRPAPWQGHRRRRSAGFARSARSFPARFPRPFSSAAFILAISQSSIAQPRRLSCSLKEPVVASSDHTGSANRITVGRSARSASCSKRWAHIVIDMFQKYRQASSGALVRGQPGRSHIGVRYLYDPHVVHRADGVQTGAAMIRFDS